MKIIFRSLIIVAIFSLSGWAQISNYANYGFGIQSPSSSVRLLGMGNAGIAVRDSMSLNQSNPALWQGFGSTSLQGQMYSTTVSVSEQDFLGGNTHFSGFSFKMPAGKRMGLTIGLAPITRVHSKTAFSDSLNFQADDVYYTSEIELIGGLSELYLGGGYRISNCISVGLKTSFLFGNYVVRNHTEINSVTDLESYYKRTLAIDGNKISLGVLFSDRGQRFNVAAVLDKSSQLKYWTKIENTYGPDTTRAAVKFDYPTNLTIGTSYKFAKTLAVNADLRLGFYDGEVFKKFYIFQQIDSLSDSRNTIGFSLGVEKSPRHSLMNSFLQNLYYRGGVYYQTEPVYRNSGIAEYGVSAGVSVPFFNNLNRIDLALTYGLREGFLKQNIGLEKIFSMHIGITTGEPWFRKYKRR
ncbi:MAG: hypothetical protein V1681_07125 [Candidatus Neomarinimicrobiota bacterium]